MKTLAFHSSVYTGTPYIIVLHTIAAPDPAEWDAFVSAVSAVMTSATETVCAFAVSEGGGPTSAQRRALADAFGQGKTLPRTHVFTNSAFVRGIVTAIEWMKSFPIQAHSPDSFASVCVECGLSPGTLLADYLKLAEQLPPLAVVEQLKRSVQQRFVGGDADEL
jgi:hypothetical protein